MASSANVVVEMRPPPQPPGKPRCDKSETEESLPAPRLMQGIMKKFGKKAPPDRKKSVSSSRRSSAVSSLSSISDRASNLSDDDEGANRTSFYVSRIVLSVAATLLLWATSLSVINAWIYSIIPMPDLLDTYDKVYLFVNNTQDEERDYASCVHEELVQCNRSLDLDIDIVLNGISNGADGVLEILEKNREQVAIAQSVSRSCSKTYTDSLSGLIAWQSEQPFNAKPEAAFTDACTREERDYLMKATGVVNETLKGNVYDLIEDYTGYSSYAVAQLSARIRARQAYDAEYLANKTALIEKINRLNNQTYYKLQQKIDALGLNMSLDIDLHLLTINTSELLSCNTLAGGACAAGVSMRDKIAEMKRNMSAQYAEAMDDYSIAVNRVRLKGDEELKKAEGFYDETMANSVKAVTRANEVFAQINAMFNGNDIFKEIGGDGIEKLLDCSIFTDVCDATFSYPGPLTFDNIINLNAYPPASGVKFPEMPSLSELGIPSTLEALRNIQELDDIQASVKDSVDAYEQQLQGAINAANGEAADLRAALDGVVPDPAQIAGFDDYNPPSLAEADALEEANDHAEATDTFLNKSKAALDEIGAVIPDEPPDFFTNTTYGDIDLATLNPWVPPLDFLKPQTCNSDDCRWIGQDISSITDVISSVITWLTSVDLVLRVLRWLSYLNKIWRRSSLQVEPVDMQIDSQARASGQQGFSPMQKTAMLVTSPYLIFIGIFIGGIAAAYTANRMYQPIFEAYEEGCSNVCTTGADGLQYCDRQGSYFAKQAFVVAHSYVMRDGNSKRVEGINQYESKRMLNCDKYRQETLPRQVELEGNFSQFNSTHVKSGAVVDLMRKCYDPSLVDTPAGYKDLNELLGISPPNNDCAFDLSDPAQFEPLGDGVFGGRSSVEVESCPILRRCCVTCSEFCELPDGYCDEGYESQGDECIYNGQLRRGPGSANAAMCNAEYLVHAFVLRFFFSVFIFIMLNIGRFLTMAGLIRVMWRWMNTGLYTFLGNCDINGQVNVDEEKLSAKLESRLGRVVLMGTICIVIAMSSQAAWLFSLASYGQKMQDLKPDDNL